MNSCKSIKKTHRWIRKWAKDMNRQFIRGYTNGQILRKIMLDVTGHQRP